MRIGYFGDGPWAHEALDRILAAGEVDVAVIVPRFERQDPVLQKRAIEHGIDFLPMQNVNDPASLARLAAYEVDVLVSMSFDQIMRSEILNLCPMGVINCHAGTLPFYRGRNVLNWALINDEPEFGVTVHHMDEGIDTGDIILQRTSSITDTDTYATLLDRAVMLCAETLSEAIHHLAHGTASRTKQTSLHPVGFYTGRRIDGDEWIDWTWSSRRIFNFVRALTAPGPCAHTAADGREISIRSARLIRDAPEYVATPGEVVGRDNSGLVVKTGDSTVFVSGFESSERFRPRIGTRFLSAAEHRLRRLESQIGELRGTDISRDSRGTS